MVYVNNKKFACESCIKGHRSSSCHHSDRPLFEIKKKGRPVSQCQKCRELRQSKRVHSKCTCNDEDSDHRKESSKVPVGTKSKRFIPIVPALPNGLQDVLMSSQVSSSLPADVRQRVDTLLNPCPCKSLWRCKCRSAARPHPHAQLEQAGLNTLSCAVAIVEQASPSPLSSSAQRKPTKRTSRPTTPNTTATHKRTKSYHKPLSVSVPGPDLPPILLDAEKQASGSAVSVPVFAVMPPISTITSLAGSGCTCGVQCACPGCVEHRGPEKVSKDRRNCADGCGTCIDRMSGIELPTLSQSSSTNNILDRFFARAAALPPPPTNRKTGLGIDLDPMNTEVYPDAARSDADCALAFGLVTVPKLECCGGRCACPKGTCGCGKSCDGRCKDHFGAAGVDAQNLTSVNMTASISAPEQLASAPAPIRSCCAARKAATAAAVG